MSRISTRDMFVEIMKTIAKRSTCLRRQVGAVLVKNGHIISTGYNGAPRGIKSCMETGKCLRENVKSGTKLEYCMASHAESNAIVQAAFHGIATEGSVIYTYYHPCSFCAKAIINAGIKEVLYVEDYTDELGVRLLQEAGIKVSKISMEC